MEKIAVLGGGNGAHACSADLSLAGYKVNMFELPKFKASIEPTMKRGGIEISGIARGGFAKLNKVTTAIEEAIEGVDLVLIVVPALAHQAFIETCIPYIENGQTIVFFGKGGATLQFVKALKDFGVRKNILLGETCTLPYSCRLVGPAKVEVYILLKELPMAAFPGRDTKKLVKVLKEVYPFIVPAENVLETMLTDVNALVHPSPVILNASRIEAKEDFYIYGEGVTSAVARIIGAIDKERLAIMKALGLKQVPFEELFHKQGWGPRGTILETITKADDAFKVKAPSTLQVRYITEDVPYSLVTMASLGDMLDVPTPVIKSIITIASVLNETNYWKEGRTVEKLGISGLSKDELKRLVNKGKV